MQRVDRAQLPNRPGITPGFHDEWGVGVAVQVVGLAYNPKRVERPTGWRNLFEPKYHCRVALTG